MIRLTICATSAAFSQIWQDLTNGLYITNILYDGGSLAGSNWNDGHAICSTSETCRLWAEIGPMVMFLDSINF